MGETITITANDGFSFSAYQALPEGTPKASVLIIQEIFGVNQHIKEVCDGYAESGFAAIAPAIFDRVETNVMLGYNEEGFEKGRVLAREKLNISDTIKDLSAAAKLLEQYGKPAAIGYCFGGFLAFAAATEIPELSCAVSYYGAGITTYPKQTPLVPVLFHFSDNDPGIPMYTFPPRSTALIAIYATLIINTRPT